MSTVSIYSAGNVTTAVSRGHQYDAMQKIIRRYPWVDDIWLYDQNKFLMPDKVVAMVKCHPEDVFDEATGKSMAMRKLSKKLAEQKEKRVAAFEKYIMSQMTHPATKPKAFEH